MKVWASRRSIRAEIADVPEGWLDRFAVNQPDDVRKFGDARNSTLVFRSSAVVAAIEEGRYFRAFSGAAQEGAAQEEGKE